MLLGDDRAKPVLSGFRAEHLAQAIRLEGVTHTLHGEDILTQGKVAYPPKLQIDEAVFSLG